MLLPLYLFSQPLAAGKKKFFGSCTVSSVRSDFSKYWNQVTPENEGKWGSAEPGKDSYNWTPLDNIYNYANTNNFPYKHHNLIWGQQYPNWITTLDSANQRAQVEEWIRLIGQRYPRMESIDVVNEPFHAQPPFKNALGGDGTTGWDWVITSFQWARQYCDSSVKLILNEYSILQNDDATTNLLKLVDTLRVRRLIDAIGIQCHYFELRGQSPITIDKNLNRLIATGLPVYISEFDIDEAVDSVQLQNYKTYFPIFWENPGVRGITLWGYGYGVTWKPNANLLDVRGAKRPAFQWLISYMSSPYRPSPVSPINVTGVPRNPVLVWHPNDTSVTSYRVQVSANSLFNSLLVDSLVTDTILQLDILAAKTRFYWRVTGSNNKGTSEYSITAQFVTGDQTVSVRELGTNPSQYSLFQNYPNPFNPTTQISYALAKSGFVTLKVFDVLGQEIRLLVNTHQEANTYTLSFDARRLASGIYFYQLKAGNDFIDIKKMMLLR
jgi:endo-1,4-beta-xylanase